MRCGKSVQMIQGCRDRSIVSAPKLSQLSDCRKPLLQRYLNGKKESFSAPPIVGEVLQSPGRKLDPDVREAFEPHFGHDFSSVQVHDDSQAIESARAVSALAYTAGNHIVFGASQYSPNTDRGRKLIAHELAHVVQQSRGISSGDISSRSRAIDPRDDLELEANRTAEKVASQGTGAKESGGNFASLPQESFIQLQADEEGGGAEAGMEEGAKEREEEGIEVGGEFVIFPRWHILPHTVNSGGVENPPVAPGSGVGSGIMRQKAEATDTCATPLNMRKVTSGKFEGGKTLDDYYPDLVGTKAWGSKDTAGTFDNGFRAGSSVQLIGEYASPCAAGGSAYTLGQMATIVRARANGKKLMEKGKPLEGQTLDDIKRSGRDQSKPPFRQEFDFAVTMADPISGIPYSTLDSYELEVNLTSSLSGSGGSKSVNWGVTIEASKGKVTKNELR